MDEKEAEKSVHLEMRNLKLTELQRLKQTKKIEREGELRERKGRQTQMITRNSAWPLSKD